MGHVLVCTIVFDRKCECRCEVEVVSTTSANEADLGSPHSVTHVQNHVRKKIKSLHCNLLKQSLAAPFERYVVGREIASVGRGGCGIRGDGKRRKEDECATKHM